MTVADNVAFGLAVRKRPKDQVKARVQELLELVGLAHLGKRYPSQLSGGQRQRMALARALAVEPRVLLLDEPFGALDARVREELRAWLRRLHDEVHVTTIFVTHDQEEALEIAEQIVVINEGRVEQSAPPAEVYDHPANEFVMSFVGPVTRSATGSCARTTSRCSSTRRRDPARRGHAARAARLRGPRRAAARPRARRSRAQLSRAEADLLELAEGQIVHVRVEPRRGARRRRLRRMRVSAKTDYALRAAVELAAAEGGAPVKGERLATSQAIPLRFLENILLQLRHAGIVESRRGAEGGYRLARPAAEVTLADVIRAIDGPLAGVSGARPETLDVPGPRGADARRLGRRARRAALRARARHAGRRRGRRAAGRGPRASSSDRDAWVSR